MLHVVSSWFPHTRCVASMNRTGFDITLLFAAVLAFGAGCHAGRGVSPSQPSGQQSTSLKPTANVRPLTDRKFERTPERLARGRYLVNGVGECFACHGPYDLNAPGWPPVRGKEGSGLATLKVPAHPVNVDGRATGGQVCEHWPARRTASDFSFRPSRPAARLNLHQHDVL